MVVPWWESKHSASMHVLPNPCFSLIFFLRQIQGFWNFRNMDPIIGLSSYLKIGSLQIPVVDNLFSMKKLKHFGYPQLTDPYSPSCGLRPIQSYIVSTSTSWFYGPILLVNQRSPSNTWGWRCYWSMGIHPFLLPSYNHSYIKTYEPDGYRAYIPASEPSTIVIVPQKDRKSQQRSYFSNRFCPISNFRVAKKRHQNHP